MALITSLLVDGVEVAATRLRDQSITYDNQINGRSVLECVLVDKTISPVDPYIPTVRDTVLLEIDGTAVFGGILWAERVGNIAGPGRGVQTQATFTDYKALLDRVYFNGPIAAGSLASQLAPLITNMLPHGITLSGSQESGPTMPAQGFDFKTIRECLDSLSAQTVLSGPTWIYTISPFGVFRMYEAGTQACPFALSEAVGNYRSASWVVDLNNYVNELWFRYGPSGLTLISQTFTGDGATQDFTLAQTLVMATTGVAPSGYVVVTRAGPAVTNENIDAEPGTGPAMWHYDAVTNTLIQDDGGTVLQVGDTVVISYFVLGPFSLFERDDIEYAAVGPFTDVLTMPEVTDSTIAQSILSAELARRLGLQKKLTVLTEEPGAEPFQTVTCTMPSLEVSGDYLITEVSLVEVTVNHNGGSGEREFAFELQCVEGNRYRENWEPFWRPDPRTLSGGQYPVQVPPSSSEGCVGLPILFESHWESGATDEWSTGGGELILVPAVSGNGVQRTDLVLGDSTDYTLDRVLPEHQSGCLEFYFRYDGGTTATSDMLWGSWNEDVGLATDCPFVHLECREDRSCAVRASTTAVGEAFAFVSGPDWYSQTAFSRIRVEYGLSTYSGGGLYAADGYLRLFRDGLLHASRADLLWHAGPSAPGRGFDYARLQVFGTVDEFILRGIAGAGSSSPSASTSLSVSPSSTASASTSPSSSVSPSAGNSPSVSPSVSPSPSPSSSASVSPSSSASRSVSPSVSPSSSSSRSQSPSASVSPSSSVSPSAGAGFPAQVGRTVGIVNSTPGTSHPITLPSGVQVGNLLLVTFSCNGAPTLSIGSGSGWNVIGPTPQSTNITAAIYWKIADGTDALTLTTSTSQDSVHRTHRFTGTSNTATTVTGTSTLLVASANGNPSAHTPPGGADDYLWVVTYHGDGATASAAPTNYTDLVTASISGSRGTCYAERELNASSEDPGAWTCVLTNGVMYVLAIEPT